MRSRGKKRRRKMLATCLILAAAALWALRRASVDTLLARATANPLPAGYQEGLWTVGWLSPDRIIAFGTDTAGRSGVFEVRPKDGNISPLTPLNAALIASAKGLGGRE